MTNSVVGLLRRFERREGPLSGLRLVVPLPDAQHWFGRDLALAKDHINALRELGAAVFRFNISPAYCSDRRKLARQFEQVRRFRPDAAIGAPHALFALAVQSLEEGEDAEAKNLLLDDLDLPTVFYWDHVLTQIIHLPAMRRPKESGGVLALLHRLFHHRRAYHFFPDSGHIARINTLARTNFDASHLYVPSVPRDYIDFGARSPKSAHTTTVGFFGNLFLTPDRDSLRPELLQVRQQAIAAYDADWTRAAFDCYEQAIDGLGANARMRLGLDPDNRFYWRFLGHELPEIANGAPRLHRLLACGRPVTYFGGFADPQSKTIAQNKGLIIGRELPPDQRLAAAFRNTRVALDVVTAPFINGFSHKLLACFASGGFMLTTRKADILSALGDAGEAISYSSASELAAKLEHFLGSEGERVLLTSEIGARVRRDYSTRALFARTIPAALSHIRMN